MAVFKTETNSIYSVDFDRSEVARMRGEHPPTPRQGEDGEFKHCEAMTVPIPGFPVLFDWDGLGHCTKTSPVQAVMLLDEEESALHCWWLSEDGESCTATLTL
jgi:hypothetical protein